jgi:hypothetical protein
MSKHNIPEDMVIITQSAPSDDYYSDPRRGAPTVKLPSLSSVDINDLQVQINIFMQQLSQVMRDTPEKIGAFHLDEFEVQAGLVVEGKGGIRIGLVSEIGGNVNASFKFVLRRSK